MKVSHFAFLLFLASSFLLEEKINNQKDKLWQHLKHKIHIENSNDNYSWIIIPIVFSASIGYIIAKKIEMTSMPQMVSIFNGLGGLSAVLLSFTEINKWLSNTELYPQFVIVVLLVSLFIGSVAFTGSLLAFVKLDGQHNDKSKDLYFVSKGKKIKIGDFLNNDEKDSLITELTDIIQKLNSIVPG